MHCLNPYIGLAKDIPQHVGMIGHKTLLLIASQNNIRQNNIRQVLY